MEDYKANSRGTERNLTIGRVARDLRAKKRAQTNWPGLELGSWTSPRRNYFSINSRAFFVASTSRIFERSS